MRVLMIGDIVGKPGRRAVSALVPGLRRDLALDVVVANGENVAGGRGITVSTAKEIFSAGVDVITSGNHIWAQQDIFAYLDTEAPLLRPANYPEAAPGRGIVRFGALTVINLMGRTFMYEIDDPFRTADRLLETVEPGTPVLVDMHAEATSEKVALGWYLDGRETVVVGTHTHIPTADARVLPKGTAYITDVGMTGPRGGVIGVKREQAIESLLTQMPVRFETSQEDPWLMGVLISCSGRLRADSIEQVLMPRPS